MNDIDAQINEGLRPNELAVRDDGPDACDAVFAAADRYSDPLLAWIKREIVLSAGAWETMEDALMARIAAAGGGPQTDDPVRSALDASLKAEHPLAMAASEEIEERLMKRIDARGGARKRALYAWPLLSVFPSLSAVKKGAAALVCAALVFGLALYFYVAGRGTGEPLMTVMARAWGSDFRSDLGRLPPGGATLESGPAGGMSFVNSAGAVAIWGGASLSVGSATSRCVEYRVFSGRKGRGGAVAFSVEKRKRGQRFTVKTPYYDIHVTGTRFVCRRDTSGAVGTLVAEGTVGISSPLLGTVQLSAGQGFAADSNGRQWRIGPFRDSAGMAVSGGDLPLAQVAAGCRLVVQSSPSGAQVYVSGSNRGITPFAMIGPRGLCTLSVRSNGFRSADTVVGLGETPVVISVTLDSAGQRETAADTSGGAAAPQEDALRTGKPATAAATDVRDMVRRLLDSAQLCESTRPAAALALYRKLADDPATPPLYRQTALFSLGRLTADRFRDTAGAAGSFGTYCILYPEGMFAGESLLRLSELELKRNPQAAVEYFCRFLAVTPGHPRRADAAYHFGLLLQQHNNYREAIRMYQLALEQLGENADDRRKEIRQMIATAQAAQQQPMPGNRDTKGSAR